MQKGGAEWLLEVVHSLYPESDIYTLVFDPEQTWDYYRDKRVIISPIIKNLPFLKKHWRKYLPLFPKAIEQFDFTGYDLVISVSYLFAKGIKVSPPAKHICYCLTPMRQAWDTNFQHLNSETENIFFQYSLNIMWKHLRTWDEKTASRPNKYLAISNAVAERILKYYHKESKVIYPPVDTDYFKPYDSPVKFTRNFFLIVSRLVPYKRIDLAVEAFNKLGYNLKIAGTGREEKKLRILISNKNIEFLGEVSKENLKDLYNGCLAVICPQEEDFGIVAAEAQACGRPVIAYNKGGIAEIVENLKTGILFSKQTPQALIDAVKQSEKIKFDEKIIANNTRQKFGLSRFREEFSNFIN